MAYVPPDLISPYPENGSVEVSWLRFVSPFHHLSQSMDALTRRGGAEPDWIVMENFEAEAWVGPAAAQEMVQIVVPRGLLTDLTSRPRPFRDAVELVGPHSPASTLHDWLYVAWQDFGRKPTESDRLYADNIFLAALRALRVPQADLLYKAVRTFGKAAYRGRNPVRYVELNIADK